MIWIILDFKTNHFTAKNPRMYPWFDFFGGMWNLFQENRNINVWEFWNIDGSCRVGKQRF